MVLPLGQTKLPQINGLEMIKEMQKLDMHAKPTICRGASLSLRPRAKNKDRPLSIKKVIHKQKNLIL